MNTAVKANHDASATHPRGADSHISGFDGSKDKLLADLKMVVVDAEQLIKEATDSSVEAFSTMRERVEGKVRDAGEKIGRARSVAAKNARQASDSAQAYVRENPWKSAGVLAAAGFVFGFLLGCRQSATNTDASN